MASDDDFIAQLLGFGLTEKEAQCYFHLLKYGPKTPSPLAKSLHTYREDVHRTLTALIDKGMVRPSLDAPTMYTAVELEPALEAALKKHEAELREMEQRKHALEELARQQRFRPSDDVSTFKVLKTMKEIVSATATVIDSIQQEFLWVAPWEGLHIASTFGVNDIAKQLADRGGHTRGITEITVQTIPLVQEVLAIGEEIRHFEGYRGLIYGVFDRKQCISAINANVSHLRLDEPATMLYTDDPVYANYLAFTFETLWQQSVPAEEQIQELLQQGSSKVDK